MPRPSMKGQFPKPDPALTDRLRAIATDLGAAEKKMFGSIAWFTPVNAQMFICVWGPDVAVRVGEKEATSLTQSGGASPFEPMPGHRMKEYIFVPSPDAADDTRLASWLERSFAYSMKLPAKKK